MMRKKHISAFVKPLVTSKKYGDIIKANLCWTQIKNKRKV